MDFSKEFRQTPEYRALNPVGKVPAMTDSDCDLSMFESVAMVQYLLDRYGEGKLQPASGTPEHAIYLQWCHFAEATFARPLGEIVNHRREFGAEGLQGAIEEMASRSRSCAKAVNEALEGRDYILGADFSAADICLGVRGARSHRLALTRL